MAEPNGIDASAVIWSAPERERAGRPLLVLLHGYGSHEGDLFGLTPVLPLGPVIASLRAPFVSEPGYSWLPANSMAIGWPDRILQPAAAQWVLDWIATTESTSVGLLGFSQGGALALQLMRLAPERFAYAINLSGFFLGGELPGDAALAERVPPMFWGRGTHDAVIPDWMIERTIGWMPGHSTLTERVYEELGHGVSQSELADVSAFIREHTP